MKKNLKHSKLAKSLNSYIILYNSGMSMYKGEDDESTLTYESKQCLKNTLKFISAEISKIRKQIKDSQRTYQRTQTPKPKSPRISKEQFISLMSIIRKYMEKDDALTNRLNDLLIEHDPSICDFVNIPSLNSNLYDELIEWAATAIGDETVGDTYGDWVSYYVYETDWGKDFDDDRVTINGNQVPFNTLSDVYDLVNKLD